MKRIQILRVAQYDLHTGYIGLWYKGTCESLLFGFLMCSKSQTELVREVFGR